MVGYYTVQSVIHSSHAMGSVKLENTEETETEHLVPRQYKSVAQHLNGKVHDLGRKFMKDAKDECNFSFSLDDYIRQIDPDLWETLTLLTQSMNDRMGRKQTEERRGLELHIWSASLCSVQLVSFHFISP